MILTANRASGPYVLHEQEQGIGAKLLRVMKLTTIVMLAFCLHTSAKGVAQQTITFSGKEVSLENVFNAIKKQTSYRFFFNTDAIPRTTKVTIDVKNAPIEQVMHLALKDQPLTFAIKGRTIFIMKKAEEDKSSLNVEMSGDPVTVSGKVTDDQGNPLVGANVKVKGSNTGITTDNQGRFTLNNVDPNATLEISFVGHETQMLSVKGKTVFSVALGQKQGILDETVVIAYGTSSRRFTTGNIATIKATDIEKQPIQNPLLALQGRVPGVEITQLSGMNGGGVTVRIQGRNSINSGLEPLIVIDGVPYPTQLAKAGLLESIVQEGSPLNYINPSDIESIDVLKDADATAIYGSRAANGAILITTKKGKAGRTRIALNLQQGWGKVSRKVDMMDTRQFLDMRYEAFQNDGIDWKASSVSASDLKVWDTTRFTDWQEALIGGTAQYSNMNFSISGGTNAIQYLIGTNFRRQTTVFPGNFEDKAGGLHFNITSTTANQKLKVQLSGNYLADRNRLPNVDLTSTAIRMEPHAPSLYNEDGTLNWELNSAGNATWNNPLVYTRYMDFNNTTNSLVSNANVGYSFLPGLQILSSFGYTNIQTDLYLPIKLEAYRPNLRPNLQRTASYGNRKMISWIVEPQITYKTNVGKGKIDALLGATIYQNNNSVETLEGAGYSNDLVMKSVLAAVTKTVTQHSSNIYRYNAIFARLNYIWNDKYIINLTARRDGSSRFGDKNNFHNFASAGLGWIFSEEKWMKKNIPLLSFGKLRTSYGTTGNDQITDYSFLSLYQYLTSGINYQSIASTTVQNISNPYLQWEETHKWQGGLDLGFIQDRIVFGVTYSRNRSSNQLIGYVLPAITGFTSITKNFPAVIQNTSLEFMLNTINVKWKYFKWTTSINLTIPKNNLVSFPNIEETSYGSSTSTTVIGKPLGLTRTYRFAGVDAATGKYVVYDKNGNPTLNGNFAIDRGILINTQSKYYGGLQNSFSYKGIDIDFLLQFVHQKGPKQLYYYNGEQRPGSFSAGFSNQPLTVLNRWQKPGDEAIVARYTTGSSVALWPPESDVWYTDDASFIRLKNVAVSWQIPTNWIQLLKLQSMRLYLQGQKIATISHITGLDPETKSSTSLPPLRLWTAGIKIEL